MSNIKNKILKEIEQKIAKRKEARNRTLNKTVESYVLSFIKNVEDINKITGSYHEWSYCVDQALFSLKTQIHVIDQGATVSVSFIKDEQQRQIVDKVKILWSKEYQEKEKCESELVLDIIDIMLKQF